MAYNAAKAAEYNKLIQQGLSPEAAAKQVGISESDGNYEIDENGTPATNANYGKLIQAGSIAASQRLPQPPKPTAQQLADDAETERELSGIENNPTTISTVPTASRTTVQRVEVTQSSTTTTTSGGGSVTRYGGSVPTQSSDAYSAQASTSQSELDKFNQENPGPQARKRQGLPPLSPEENQARLTQQAALSDKVNENLSLSQSARQPVSSGESFVPNTTTTEVTSTGSVTAYRSAVNTNTDQVLGEQAQVQYDTTSTRTVSATSATNTNVNPASDPSQFPAYDNEGNLEPGYAVNDETGETYYRGFDTTTNQAVTPPTDYGSAYTDFGGLDQAMIGQPGTLNDPYYGLSPQQLQDLGGADPTDPFIRARLGIPQLPGSTLNPGGFAAFQPTGVPLIDNAITGISNFANSLTSLFKPATKPAVTNQGTTTGTPPPTVIDTKAVASDATAVKEQNPQLDAAAKNNLTNIQEANVNTVKAEENIQINNRSILENEQAQAQALEQQRQAQAIIDQNDAELADDNLPESRRAELEANNAAQRASIAENAAVIDEAQINIDQSTANNEQQVNSILENQYVAAENAEAYRTNTTGGVDEDGNPVNDIANDPEFNDYGAPEYEAAIDGPLTDTDTQELTDEETTALFLEAEQEPELLSTDVAQEVDPNADLELLGEDLDDGIEAELAEPVDPDADPELLGGPEEEIDPFTELAEPVDPDADPELVQLGGPEEEIDPFTELAEPVDPDADPELLGGPEEEIDPFTELAEPVDPDADPELEQLGGPPADEELVQLGGPEDVDTANDDGLRTPDGELEDGSVAETGLREPTDDDVAAAEQAAAKANAINQATLQSRYKQPGNTDWRFRLNLAPTSDYLYNAGGNNAQAAGILAPLRATNGVVFPYTPTISTSYQANYEQYDLIHSNYRGIYYKNSRVNDVSVRAIFTAQDSSEANYLLAVIHFFRSVTKMFYGQDTNRGVPPPLVFLNGLGNFQFSNHPCVVGTFNYTLPSDVDYIRATSFNNYGGNLFDRRQPIAVAPGGVQFAGAIRLANALLPKNAQPQTPTQNTLTGSVTNTDLSTYVPTKMEIDLTLIPVQTRDQVSNQFSLKEFANGNLIKKGFW